MKKLLMISIILCLYITHPITASANNHSPKEQAEKIYDACQKQIPVVNKKDVILGNKADVAHERALRQCLKSETLKIAATFISPSELKNFNTALNQDETASFALYKALIFCQANQDQSWCDQFYQEDTSLGKLLLEKQLTSQIMQILINTINAKQGGLIF